MALKLGFLFHTEEALYKKGNLFVYRTKAFIVFPFGRTIYFREDFQIKCSKILGNFHDLGGEGGQGRSFSQSFQNCS